MQDKVLLNLSPVLNWAISGTQNLTFIPTEASTGKQAVSFLKVSPESFIVSIMENH
ncbi:MAG: hypothetical protein L5656_11280 [Thermanaeromonas sp.]|nr:hypothetical protein [Thermanaeromonas sp.]